MKTYIFVLFLMAPILLVSQNTNIFSAFSVDGNEYAVVMTLDSSIHKTNVNTATFFVEDALLKHRCVILKSIVSLQKRIMIIKGKKYSDGFDVNAYVNKTFRLELDALGQQIHSSFDDEDPYLDADSLMTYYLKCRDVVIKNMYALGRNKIISMDLLEFYSHKINGSSYKIVITNNTPVKIDMVFGYEQVKTVRTYISRQEYMQRNDILLMWFSDGDRYYTSSKSTNVISAEVSVYPFLSSETTLNFQSYVEE